MPIFTRDGRSILFVHVPKTGGTSVERMFIRAGWDVGLRATPHTHPAQSRLHRISPQHLHAPLLTELLRLGRFDAVFLVVRDPLLRFRSEYVMRNKRHEEAGRASHVEAWTDDVLDRLAANPSLLDNHLRPQHEFVLPQARVYRLEDGLEAAMADLRDHSGLHLPTEVPHTLDSGAGGGLSSRDVEVTDAVAARVRALYARDHEVFGYA
ncbi:sulfotransferase family 2 domain-containing protein [Nocardioides exalbidus]|uniref:sulfotransferase family 2 domain-containing protein n=1 Tax=Nocardioides exalbidus TaxID=402596 RepID=UPI001587EA75|nr:sulfotransferase family 2 domain-containing protein [Nocardioides exalbidus]